ncbi:MAG TPA: response regulator [Flavisolibacter sp.]|nr:response regulator [Flavisolibacter sp.]
MAKFLIVDDDLDDREMFCEALQQVSPQSTCYNAPNGKRAILALDNREIEIPDLIFLDINMPVMNGWECLSRLKKAEAYRHIPVIMYSTSSDPDDARKARQLEAVCLFSKPPSFRELKNSLALVVHYFSTKSLESLTESSPRFLTGSIGTK